MLVEEKWDVVILQATLCLSLLLLLSCTSTDSAFYDEEGSLLKDHPPVDYRIAVAPLYYSSLEKTLGKNSFSGMKNNLQEIFVEEVRALNTSIDVFLVTSPDPYNAARLDADLLIRLRLESASFDYSELTSRWILTGVFWFTTWIGGLFVEDSTYETSMVIQCELLNLDNGYTIIDDFILVSDKINLIFWERNTWFSIGFFESLILPPFWTSDDADQTNRSLVRRSLALIAAKLKKYLIGRYPDKTSLSSP